MEKEKSETITSDMKSEKCAISNSENCIQQAIHLQKQSAEGLMSLLRNIGQAYVDLSSYNCQAALQVNHNFMYKLHYIYNLYIYVFIVGICFFTSALQINCFGNMV